MNEVECPLCRGTGFVIVNADEAITSVCELCDGEMVVESEVADRYKGEKDKKGEEYH